MYGAAAFAGVERERACILDRLLCPWCGGIVGVHELEDVHLADDSIDCASRIKQGDSMHWRKTSRAQEVPEEQAPSE